MVETNYPVIVHTPPGIFRTDKQDYAVAGCWIPIPKGVTIETLPQYVLWKPIEVEKPIKKYFVKATRGEKKYTVEVWSDKVTCNCSGYRWRAKCKHATAVKKLQKK